MKVPHVHPSDGRVASEKHEAPSPRLPFDLFDGVVVGLGVAVVFRPSMPIAVAFAAAAGAWVAQRIFIDLARAYQNSLIGAEKAAAASAESAARTEGMLGAFDGRVSRLENRASWADGRPSGGR